MAGPALRRRRLWTSWIAVAPVAALTLAGLPHALAPGVVRTPACWLLPSAQVMTHPASGSCPLHMLATIRAAGPGPDALEPVRSSRDLLALAERSPGGAAIVVATADGQRHRLPFVASTRSARLLRLALALVVSALMLAVPLFVLWNARIRAAVPLTLFYGAAAVAATTLLSGQHSPAMTRAAVAALAFAPGALTHLALTFPRERPVLAAVPRLAQVPYAAAAVLVPLGWIALERERVLAPAYLALLLVLSGAAWTVLLVSCAMALRESESATERARARLVFFGALTTPLVPTLLAMPAAGGTARLGVLYLWSAAATMPLPIALAISRYNLFDLGWDARNALARALYLGAASAATALVVAAVASTLGGRVAPLEASPLFLACFVALAATEPLRTRMRELIEAAVAPRLRELHRVQQAFERTLTLPREDDEVAASLADALREALDPDGMEVHLCSAGAWRTAHAQGDREILGSQLRDAALAVLDRLPQAHLPAAPELERLARPLRSAGVEAVAAIECSGERFGFALVGRPKRRTPYTRVELALLRSVAASAGTALRNARLTNGLLAAERSATTDRLAADLAHDLGKDLGWIRKLSQRLPRLAGDPERWARDAELIHELSEELSAAVARFVESASDAAHAGPEADAATLEELLDVAVRRADRTHGAGRVTWNLDPSVRALRFHEHLGRAVGSLLDAALRAGEDDAAVRVFATLEGGALVTTVEETGGASSRRSGDPRAGGALALSRDVVEGLGGTLAFDAERGCGGRAVIRIPREVMP